MSPVESVGRVEDHVGARVEVCADPVSATIDLHMRDHHGEAAICLPPARARLMILLLQDALRHLED